MTYQFLSRLVDHHKERAKDAACAIRELSDSALVPLTTSAPIIQLARQRVDFHTSAARELQDLLDQVPVGKDLLHPTTRQPIISR